MNLHVYIAVYFLIISWGSSLRVDIDATVSKSTSYVKVSGMVEHVITDREMESYGIGYEALKKGVERLLKVMPQHLFVRRPTPEISAPHDDLYIEFGWPELKVVYTGLWAEDLDVTSKLITISQQKFQNTRYVPCKHTAKFDQYVEEDLKIKWHSDAITAKDLDILFITKTADNLTMYTSHWGHNVTKSNHRIIGLGTSTELTLLPGDIVIVNLLALHNRLSCKILFQTHFSGVLAVNFPENFEGHYYHALDIDKVLKNGGLPRTWNIPSDIQVTYFTKPSVEIE